jgi:hypothetical protein
MTGPVLEVDIDALNADGRRLESLGEPFTPSNCAPPGADPVSLGAARALNAHESALIEVLNYATLVRQYGGAVVRSAAVALNGLIERVRSRSVVWTTPMRHQLRRPPDHCRCLRCHPCTASPDREHPRVAGAPVDWR